MRNGPSTKHILNAVSTVLLVHNLQTYLHLLFFAHTQRKYYYKKIL